MLDLATYALLGTQQRLQSPRYWLPPNHLTEPTAKSFMTTIEYLGHSGITVEHDGKLLVCDPWLGGRGAYNASWFPYPEYPGEKVVDGKDGLDHLRKADAVYISHEHLDHYDPDFLATMPLEVPLLTGRVHKKRLLKKLRKSGFTNIIELDDFESYEIAPGFTVKVRTPTFNCPPHWFDSCALIEADGLKIFNLNDCNLALPVDEIRDWGIDVLLAQASPAIWYPTTYTNYEPARKNELKGLRRQSALESFVGAAKALQPRLAIPFAGPPIFFDPELAEVFLEEDSMFCTPAVAAAKLEAETDIAGMVLNPGDVLEVAEQFNVTRHPEYENFHYERDRRSYFESKKEDKQKIVAEVLAAIPAAAPDLFNRFRRHFLPFLKGHSYFTSRIGIRVLFRVSGPEGGEWVVDFRTDPKAELIYENDGEACQYQFDFESHYLDQVLRDELSWEDLLLSLRFRASRDPDRYNQHLFTLFKMCDSRALNAIMDAELAAVEGTRPEQTFLLEVGQQRYNVQRYCPHGGSDLSEAAVADGYIVCPGHHWRFALDGGDCADAECKIWIEEEPADADPTPDASERREDHSP